MLTRWLILGLMLIPAAGTLMPQTSISMPPATNLVATAKNSNMAFNLNTYQWKNRLLLIFAPSKDNPDYQRQMQLIQKTVADFQERDLIAIELLAQYTSQAETQTLNEADAANLRSEFNVAPEEFRVILIGKDGTAKRRDQKPVAPEVIFNQIDEMPMRRQEMRDSQR
ncbi:DUF4174 domain-containing protein [Microcoleus sp. FACHB-672]|uniref:DUF4174 domain-containing protein n=1 Tax=Microcoleus sp. FACHB-672 TaxID=2692825 RepID=UPI0018F00D49|nr:DUF4174 domain-containing protein [Microcoleus sp. FACHB-672]